jgi:hypothetical protein
VKGKIGKDESIASECTGNRSYMLRSLCLVAGSSLANRPQGRPQTAYKIALLVAAFFAAYMREPTDMRRFQPGDGPPLLGGQRKYLRAACLLQTGACSFAPAIFETEKKSVKGFCACQRIASSEGHCWAVVSRVVLLLHIAD